MKKKWRNILGYIFGLLILGVILYLGGTQAIELAVTPNLGILFACFLANLAVYSVSSFRWGYTTNHLIGEKITSYAKYFSYFISSRFFGQYISQAGGDFMVKPGLLKQINGISLKYGLTSVVIEKLFDISLIGILLVPSFLYLFAIVNELSALIIVLTITLLFLLLLLFQTSRIIRIILGIFSIGLKVLKKIPLLKRLVKGNTESNFKSIEHLEIIQRGVILNIFSLSVLRFLILILRLYLLNASLELGIPLPLLIAGIPIAQLTLALALTPGSLGFLEGGWYGILTIGGIGEIERSAFLIGQRVYWSIFIGIIFLVTYISFGFTNLIKTRQKDL
jgi:uncharacterized protein (TIRG00374 family)